MGANVLGGRKTRAIAVATGLPVIWAWVCSHHNSGRVAMCTTADHQHGTYDRRTGEWELIKDPECTSSCRILFAYNADPAMATARAEGMRRNDDRDWISKPLTLGGVTGGT